MRLISLYQKMNELFTGMSSLRREVPFQLESLWNGLYIGPSCYLGNVNVLNTQQIHFQQLLKSVPQQVAVAIFNNSRNSGMYVCAL